MPQLSYDPIDLMDAGTPRDEAHKIMRRERDKQARQCRAEGFRAAGWALANQLRPYRSLGVPDGTTRTVYMLNVSDAPYHS